MNNEPPARIVIGNFSDLKHKINKKWPNISIKIILVHQLHTLHTGTNITLRSSMRFQMNPKCLTLQSKSCTRLNVWVLPSNM